jgi:DNA-binding CsgD family transcriptional regulator
MDLQVLHNGQLVARLTPGEEDVLYAIWTAFPMPRSSWEVGEAAITSYEVVKQQVRRIRRKVGQDFIICETMRGYRLNPDHRPPAR